MCRRGDIYYVDFGMNIDTRKQSGIRPVVIVSNNKANAHSPVITVVPLTSKVHKKRFLPTHVYIPASAGFGLSCGSLALAEQEPPYVTILVSVPEAYALHAADAITRVWLGWAAASLLLATALAFEGPVALRYPRGVGEGAPLTDSPQILPIGQGELVREGADGVIVALGSRVAPALEAARMFCEETGREVAVFNARFVKPLPQAQLLELAATSPFMLLVEENALPGGFGSAVLELLADHDALSGLRVKRLGVPDSFVEHGSQKELRARLGINRDGMIEALRVLACS